MSPGQVGAKSSRPDARRNYDAVLAAAKKAFAQHGTDVAMEIVIQEAGVGRGTLYRHFPTREHLFAAIMSERVDELDAKARELLTAPDVSEALEDWLRLYDRCATEYPGMSLRVGDGLTDDSSPVGPACGPMKSSFALLFDRARREKRVRADISAIQVLALIAALPKDPSTGKTAAPCLAVVLDGLKP
ncbi:TetR/AcrR family transcriptional regulator [Amycolatopsis sp. MEPSY49]|uniref:TetR/AcrR family transcriptional regulator n=1 Tax=Amycolatopsis sp. MEPSY49 TaxID=3151600 RepID=UPI003EF6E18E